MAKRRITLSLDADLVDRFQACADLERRSLSALVEQWLEQVVEPAEWVASMADSQRGTGVENIQAVIAALQVAQEQQVTALLNAKGGGGKRGPAGHAPAASPPSCNTGGKLPKGKGGRHAH